MKNPLLLWASILVNVALVSFVVTRFVAPTVGPGASNPAAQHEAQNTREKQGPRFDRRLPRELRSLARLEMLTDEQRSSVRAIIDARLPAIQAQGEKARIASRNFREAMNQPGFDPDAVKAKAELMIAERLTFHRLATQTLIDAVATLPPDAQSALIEENRRHRDRRRRGRRHRIDRIRSGPGE
ncbi:MAG: periplasmic heavy metal sensor [Pseudomonadota bacterium]